MNQMFTEKAEKEMEESWRLQHEAVRLLDLVVAEWNSDPMSVQCFDSRIVKRSKEVVERLKKLTLF